MVTPYLATPAERQVGSEDGQARIYIYIYFHNNMCLYWEVHYSTSCWFFPVFIYSRNIEAIIVDFQNLCLLSFKLYIISNRLRKSRAAPNYSSHLSSNIIQHCRTMTMNWYLRNSPLFLFWMMIMRLAMQKLK